MRPILALAGATLWVALNIMLWHLRLPDVQWVGVSLLLGIIFFAAFFCYVGRS
jgi:hypothetical protein